MTAAYRPRLGTLLRADWVMTAAAVLLLLTGIVFVYSAGYQGQGRPSAGLWQKQVLWAGIGFGLYLFFAAIDYREILRWGWLVYAAGLVLTALTFSRPLGLTKFGAARWLSLGPVQAQPSEMLKLAVVLVLSRFLAGAWEKPGKAYPMAIALLTAALPAALILRQPDLGTAMIFPPLLLAMLYVSGAPLRAIRPLALAGIFVVLAVAAAIVVPKQMGWDEETCDRMVRMVGLSPYQRDRILVFLDPDMDPLGSGWNKAQSQLAVGSGGVWGKGYLKGTQNIFGFLPRTVAPTDFIFSVIAEEAGFVGAAFLLAMFLILIVSGVKAGSAARDAEGRLLCAGVTTMLFCHVFVNIAMTIGLAPITGLPLPLVSYGGSFMVGMMGALGMIQSVYIRGRSVVNGSDLQEREKYVRITQAKA